MKQRKYSNASKPRSNTPSDQSSPHRSRSHPQSIWRKQAAETHKPNGSTVWRIDDIPGVYTPLTLDALPGLGPATERRLRKYKIESVIDLYHAERALVRQAWGSVIGLDVHDALHAKTQKIRAQARQHLSHGRVLEPELRSWARARPIMRFVTTCVVHRCRRECAAAQRVDLDAIGTRGGAWALATAIEPNNDERETLRATSRLWDKLAEHTDEGPKRFSITASNLITWPTRQRVLFENYDNCIQTLIEQIRRRFGARSIAFGDGIDHTGTYTGVKIAFEHVPDAEDFEWLGIEMPRIETAPDNERDQSV